MSDTLINALVNAGILGPILVALAIAYVKLQRNTAEIQEKRVKDSQEVVNTVLKLVDDQNTVTSELSAALDKYAESARKNTEMLIGIREHIRQKRD